MRLTIGMATYDDFQGCWWTVQALRSYHRPLLADCELLVVDNNPSGPDSATLREFLGWVKGDFKRARYLPFGDVKGTAAPRDTVFRLADGEYVLCLDSHVLLLPGALEALVGHYAGDPLSRDLLSGPMIYDDFKNFASHFRDEWRAEMWGTWGAAFVCPCGSTSVENREGDGARVDVLTGAPAVACRECGALLPQFLPATEAENPFEIGAMGLGLFSCRREAWPGFNVEFSGFGGEEWYVHEKVRRAGGRCLCLPRLQWMHRFGRPTGVSYPLTRWHKARNYYLGHTELGLDTAPVYEHFVGGGHLSEAEWASITAGQAHPSAPAQAPAGCGSCGSVKLPESLEAAYEEAARVTSDINEHVPTLRDLAAGCDHVTEFGVRTGVSTTGLLAGQPKVLISYDVNDSPQARALMTVAGKTHFEFRRASSLEVEIDETDMVFIDTLHVADHLYQELKLHAPKARKWVVMHDTVTFGEHGEHGMAGLMPAVRRYLLENPKWTVHRHYRNNNGLLILTCDPAYKKALPPKWKQGWNVLKASFRAGQNVLVGYGRLQGTEAQERRLALCTVCATRNGEDCAACGCPLDKKTSHETEFCPEGQWHQEKLPEGGAA